jgi:hypothetical protein
MDVQNSHRPFFLAGIATVLTLGCVWGAINLFTMIVGVLSRVVPGRSNSLWPTFVSLNLRNLTRVSFQIATDFSPSGYPIMGISGFIEVVGLTLWGYELFSNMFLRENRVSSASIVVGRS